MNLQIQHLMPSVGAPRVHPDTPEARQIVLRWGVDHGLVQGEEATRRLSAIDPASLAGRVYPTVDFERLCLAAQHLCWLFVHDDTTEQLSSEARHHEARSLQRDLLSALVGDPASRHVLVDAARSLTEQLRALGGTRWWRRFQQSQGRYLSACLWEANNEAKRTIPDLQIYVVMRRLLGGVEGCFDLLVLGESADPRDALSQAAALATLAELANNHIVWANDVLGIGKELRDGATSSLVFALAEERGLALPQAIEQAAQMCRGQAQAFDRLAQALSLQDNPYVQGLRGWMQGHLDWVVCTHRFDVSHSDEGFAIVLP